MGLQHADAVEATTTQEDELSSEEELEDLETPEKGESADTATKPEMRHQCDNYPESAKCTK